MSSVARAGPHTHTAPLRLCLGPQSRGWRPARARPWPQPPAPLLPGRPSVRRLTPSHFAAARPQPGPPASGPGPVYQRLRVNAAQRGLVLVPSDHGPGPRSALARPASRVQRTPRRHPSLRGREGHADSERRTPGEEARRGRGREGGTRRRGPPQLCGRHRAGPAPQPSMRLV